MATRIGDRYTRKGQLFPPGRAFVTGRESVAEFWQQVEETGVETIDIETLAVAEHEQTGSGIHRDVWNSSIAETQ